ncbi:DUF3800 domain-containing protein [Leucobacter sp. NPDC015123]|uniref:DUF3800 domain-containing protein n=1 Tax=Leucobacter sp. NPDC015123 TaxID=3364129 RepID=UPI0036F482A0
MSEFGEYVVYVDESGDHSLSSIDKNYPVFVLAFCIFPIETYITSVVPRIQRLKFNYFGHDMTILHEREIRKSAPPFDILMDESVRTPFMSELNAILCEERYGIVSAAIRKEEFLRRRGSQTDPYHVALEFGLERVFLQLQQRGQKARRVRVVFESRGKAEDDALELEFHRIMAATKMRGMPETLDFTIVSKMCNSAGLQLADMVARPIGLKLLRPTQANRAWDVLEPHIVRSPKGNIHGYGLKVYP